MKALHMQSFFIYTNVTDVTTIQARIMTDLLEKPEPPTENECCDSACTPCVWDTYYAARKAWRLQQAELKAQQDVLKNQS